LTALSGQGVLYVEATGTSYSIAEVGEQLAFLGAALQISEIEEVTYCTPWIDDSTSIEQSVQALEPSGRSPSSNCRTHFHINLEKHSAVDNQGPGSCWRHLIRYPVVVSGFPIFQRPEPDTGLEVTLDIMGGLVNVKRIVDYSGITFLKGFAAMFAITKVVGDVVYWHLYYNQNAKYISYSDPQVPRDQIFSRSLSINALETSRHILGWCEDIQNYAGKYLLGANTRSTLVL
jgi:hypothetical protein